MFRLDDDRVVDATMTGGVARYINHTCDPNCVTETVDLQDTHIIIFAARRIERGEELSYDYKVSFFINLFREFLEITYLVVYHIQGTIKMNHCTGPVVNFLWYPVSGILQDMLFSRIPEING